MPSTNAAAPPPEPAPLAGAPRQQGGAGGGPPALPAQEGPGAGTGWPGSTPPDRDAAGAGPIDRADVAPPAGEGAPAAVVQGVRFHALSVEGAAEQVLAWARDAESRAVCFSNAHGVVEAHGDAAFRDVLNGADLNLPDGAPVVWSLRHLGLEAERVYGPDVTHEVLRRAAAERVPVAFYGSSPATLDALAARLPALAPGLRVACMVSPPFRPLTDAEDAAYVRQLAASGARVVFVGLGCPRQERWVVAHRGRVPAVMLAVGAAFDFHAGRVRQAPAVVQRAGLEWAFRLAVEPRRLWPRYARVVPRFLWGMGRQAVGGR